MSNSAAVELQRLIDSRTAQIGIIGLGYVGLPLSLTFCRAGFSVTGFDIDQRKTEALGRGESYIRHIGSDAIAAARATGRFTATSRFDLLREMDAILICVPTPLNDKREPDLGYIESTARDIARRLRWGQLVVLESSTYPGTTDEVLVPILESSGIACTTASVKLMLQSNEAANMKAVARAANAGPAAEAAQSFVPPTEVGGSHPAELRSAQRSGGTSNVGSRGISAQARVEDAKAASRRAFVAFSPEREDPGNRQFTTRTIPKLVGGADEEAGRLATALYSAAFEQVVPVSSARVAEMSKLLENTYRCVNIALVNELKQLCMRMGIDVCEVIDAAATKPFGFQAFYPGPGLGGHCIPIDPFYLAWKARQYDFTTRFIELAGEINTEMPYKVVEFIGSVLNDAGKAVRGSRVLVLGAAYKKDIDDLRESPAVKIMGLLRRRGAVVEYNDPHCPHLWRGRQNDFELFSVEFQPENANDYDCVVIATDHSCYDFRAIAAQAKLLVDTRNATRGINLPHVHRC